MSVETITCPTCERELQREKTPDGYLVKVTGKHPEKCCQAFATDGHKVVGAFVTEP